MPKYKLTSKALKQMGKLDLSTRKKIFNKLDYFTSFSNPLDFAEPISGVGLGQYRFRIGDYRVVFDIKKDVYKILKVGHRRWIYR